jgi:hypothetical protein
LGFFSWIKKVLSYDPSVYKPHADQSPGSGMNEGDFRSGPKGYSPNTSYPEAFYGSGGNSDEAQDEGDFNR